MNRGSGKGVFQRQVLWYADAMFRSDKPDNYEEVYKGLVERLARADYRNAMANLGARDAGREVALECLGRTLLIGPGGVRAEDGGPVDFNIRLCGAYYILHGGAGDWTGEWVAYRDFKDGAFFHAAFSQVVEHKIAAKFAGRADRLEKAAEDLGATPLEAGLGGDLCLRFSVLPKTPLVVVFYDKDEDFPASARILFDSSAPLFLDMECLAALGLILANQLAQAAHEGD